MIWIKRHALLVYFALAFAISWGGVLMAVGATGIPGTADEFEALLPHVVLAMLAGPSGAPLLIYNLVLGAALWVVAAVVRGPMTQEP